MNRRNFFKMLGAVAASAVCAPLAKLLPPKQLDFSRAAFSRGVRIGRTIHINKPVRWSEKELALSIEDFTRRYIQPEIAKIAAEHEADYAFVSGDSWPS